MVRPRRRRLAIDPQTQPWAGSVDQGGWVGLTLWLWGVGHELEQYVSELAGTSVSQRSVPLPTPWLGGLAQCLTWDMWTCDAVQGWRGRVVEAGRVWRDIKGLSPCILWRGRQHMASGRAGPRGLLIYPAWSDDHADGHVRSPTVKAMR